MTTELLPESPLTPEKPVIQPEISKEDIETAKRRALRLKQIIKELNRTQRVNPQALDYELFVKRGLKWIKPRE